MAWITERPRRDKSTALSVQWRDKSGKRHSESFDGKQKTQAEKFLKLVEAHDGWPPGWVRGVGFADAIPSGTTVLEIAAGYVSENTRAAERHKADSARLLKRYVENDPIAKMDAALLTKAEARKWVTRLSKRGLSAKTVNGVVSVLRASFRRAIDDETLTSTKNPFSGVTAQKNMKASRVESALTVDQFFTLVDLVPEHYKLFVETAGKTGMRWGEITALTVGDLNASGYLEVSKAWVETGSRGKYKIGPPKSDRGVRRVYLDADLFEQLTKHVANKKSTELIFVTQKGKPVRHNNFYGRVWRKAALGLVSSGGSAFAPRFHDLRHSHATWLLEAGQPVHRVAARLGHDPAVLMRVYAHLLDQGAAETAEVIGVITERNDTSPKALSK